MIDSTMNPFDADVDPKFLFNIATGKATQNATADFLVPRLKSDWDLIIHPRPCVRPRGKQLPKIVYGFLISQILS